MQIEKKEYLKDQIKRFQQLLEHEELDYVLVVSERNEDAPEGLSVIKDESGLALACIIYASIRENQKVNDLAAKVLDALSKYKESQENPDMRQLS